MRDVARGTVVIYSDVGCPWSHVVLHRLHEARRRLALDGRLAFDHRAFPLELINSRPTPRHEVDAEIPVAGALAPHAGWQIWQAPDSQYPVTMLPALEAVQAAKEQGLAAAEELDRGLRRAFFAESRCISLRHVILEVASESDGVDVALLAAALDDGRARRVVIDQWKAVAAVGVRGSPHLFLADGSDAYSPGIEVRWESGHGEGFPVVERDEPAAVEEVLRRAAA